MAVLHIIFSKYLQTGMLDSACHTV